jgi:hypothetical protein
MKNKKTASAASKYTSSLYTETGPKSKGNGSGEPRGKALSKTSYPVTKGPDVKFNSESFKAKGEAVDKAASKKKRNESMAKLAAGAAGTAAAMYYGLTKTVGGNEHKDAQGNVTGKSKRRRVPIWSKDEGW